jgi:hypothetical protein
MKKIYLKPEMELTECVMMQTAICSGGTPTPVNPTPSNPGFPFPSPKKRVF